MTERTACYHDHDVQPGDDLGYEGWGRIRESVMVVRIGCHEEACCSEVSRNGNLRSVSSMYRRASRKALDR